MTTTSMSLPIEPTRRDFLYLATAMTGGVGTAVTIWPFIDQMRPSADVLAVSSVDIDLAGIEPGQRVTFQWRGRPIFVDYRTPEAIQEARSVPMEDLKDPERDEARTLDPQWLVVIGVCTHLGCVPLGQADGSARGDWGGWFCPCHGSHYDTSGRVRAGPAPLNLTVPPYKFDTETMITIG
jgi:ubiquinol-cytochrome c reductase iron-sulfur subunit